MLILNGGFEEWGEKQGKAIGGMNVGQMWRLRTNRRRDALKSSVKWWTSCDINYWIDGEHNKQFTYFDEYANDLRATYE